MEEIEVFWSTIPKEDLDKPIDYNNKTITGQTIPKDLVHIAATLVDWTGDVASALKLSDIDVADITANYPGRLDLQK